jgi:hypothetical protein
VPPEGAELLLRTMRHHHRAEPQPKGQQAEVTQIDRAPLAHAAAFAE